MALDWEIYAISVGGECQLGYLLLLNYSILHQSYHLHDLQPYQLRMIESIS